MATEYLIITLIGGLLCLDKTAPQLLISRPVVAAPILGALLGDFITGLIIGSFLELVWIDRVPIGGYIPPDDTLAAVVITAVVITVSGRLGFISPEIISLSFIIFLPLALAGQKVQCLIVKSNNRLTELALIVAEKPDIKMLEWLHIRGLVKAFVVPALIILVSTALGVEVMCLLYRNLPDWSFEPLRLSYYLLPLIGIASGLNMVKLKREVPIFAAFSLAAIILLEYLLKLR